MRRNRQYLGHLDPSVVLPLLHHWVNLVRMHLAQPHLLSGLLDLLDDESEDRLVSVDQLTGVSQFLHEHRGRLFCRIVVCHTLEPFPASHFIEGHARIKRRTRTDFASEIQTTLDLLSAHDVPPPPL